MKKSWSTPLVWGYEIKVSRSDFLNDQKWHAYLTFCNEFYFVCPQGLIQPNELPAEVGLLYVAKTGTCLFKKKAAARREVEIPEELWRYLLMARTTITSEKLFPRPTNEERRTHSFEYWRRWLEEKQEFYMIGRQISQSIAKHVEGVENENRRLKSENDALAVFKARLAELGVDGSAPVATWQVKSALRTLQEQIPAWAAKSLGEAIAGLEAIQRLVNGKECI
jgi:hypothetical protein